MIKPIIRCILQYVVQLNNRLENKMFFRGCNTSVQFDMDETSNEMISEWRLLFECSLARVGTYMYQTVQAVTLNLIRVILTWPMII